MPRAPTDQRKAAANKVKRDPRLRPLREDPVDHWAWLPEVVTRKVVKAPVEHNIHGRDTKPSFYEMVKAALLSHKMHHLRGVSINAIYKQVAAEWPVDLDTYRRLTRVAIKRAIELGKIEVVDGPSVSYRLTAGERPEQANNGAAKSARAKANGSRLSGPGATTKRGTTKSKRKAESDSEEDSDDDVPVKKTAKKSANAKKTGDFDTQQPGEGKWVRYISALTAITHHFSLRTSLLSGLEGLHAIAKVLGARQEAINRKIHAF